MNLQDWQDCTFEDWQGMTLGTWDGTGSIDWQDLPLAAWKRIKPEHWGNPPDFSSLSPLYPSVALESLGITQDSDFIYIPLATLPQAFTWENLTLERWQNITLNQWSFEPLTAQQLFILLILRLQSAALPAHQVRNSGNFIVVESRALAVTTSFNPNDY